jgi:GTP-binding protein HflX
MIEKVQSVDESENDRAVLVAIIERFQKEETVIEHIDELEFLASTLGLQTQHTFTQRLERPDNRTFVGKGKLEEIVAYVKAKDIGVVIFDDDLSPSQMRNLEDAIECKIYDRSMLILDIFLKRAQTAQAKTQVELARYQYLMPRLTNMWTHLERQRGGTGTMGGAGEKEIETDRRNLRNQIDVLKKKLEKIEKQNLTQRKSRGGIVRVALVGYTNVGKSTLMNLLSKSELKAENKLFATVDATVRKVVIDQIPFLLSDTVGFIRKLPHHLIESFKSTLDEIREADVLLHVVDVSHPAFEDQINVVNSTLTDIGAADIPTVMIYNKMDLYKEEEAPEGTDIFEIDESAQSSLELLKASHMNKDAKTAVFVSATEKDNIVEMKEKLMEDVTKQHLKIFPNYLKNEYY